MRILTMCVLAFLLVGCASFHSFVDALNERQIASCLELSGQVSGGFGAAASGQYRGITATGGVPIEVCQKVLGK